MSRDRHDNMSQFNTTTEAELKRIKNLNLEEITLELATLEEKRREICEHPPGRTSDDMNKLTFPLQMVEKALNASKDKIEAKDAGKKTNEPRKNSTENTEQKRPTNCCKEKKKTNCTL